MPRLIPVALLCLLCASCESGSSGGDGGRSLWEQLQQRCGKAYEGRVVEGTEASDEAMRRERLVMHVRSCTEQEIRVPFHVGENRSRTWVITRTAGGLRLKHDHRHEDGSPDAVTNYGGESRGAPDGLAIEFPADAETAALLPAAATNVWTLSIDPERRFSYALRREQGNRRFRAEFDLTREVEPPPAP